MNGTIDCYLLAYFANGLDEDSEQIRFAVTPHAEPTGWLPLSGGRPVLSSTVGERGVRDPFLVSDPANGRFLVLATDLRTWPHGDWHRAVRNGSRSIVIWESADLVSWSGPRLAPIATAGAGNTWAPKAYPRDDGSWVVFFASALYKPGDIRSAATHQRMLFTTTRDFRTFTPAEIYLDRGRDVIDVTFAPVGDRLLRFSADSGSSIPERRSQFVSQEIGGSYFDTSYSTVLHRVGEDALERGEGPAHFVSIDSQTHYLLVDEFGLRGYQLFRSRTPETGEWEHMADPGLPVGARHGSVIRITGAERERLLAEFPPAGPVPSPTP